MGALRLSIVGATLIALAIATGCSMTHNGTFCTVASPIRPSASTIAAMSDAEVRDVLAHNKLGQALCGWRP